MHILFGYGYGIEKLINEMPKKTADLVSLSLSENMPIDIYVFSNLFLFANQGACFI